jgi:hypothetical protein
MSNFDRKKAIELVERAYWREQAKGMSDAELDAWLASDLGLPAGTQFSEAQLIIIAEHRGYRGRPEPPGSALRTPSRELSRLPVAAGARARPERRSK